MRNLQKLAAGALEEVLAGAALHQILPQRLQLLKTPGERGALQDIVYGSLRQLGRLDAWLEALLERPLTDPELGWLLRVALYQLAYTRAPAHAVVHNAVSAAGEGWRRGLANAVLRNFQRRRAELEKISDEQPYARWSHPDWWIAKLQSEHPAHWQAILEASLQHPPFTLRINGRRGDVAAYLQRLTEAGLPAHQTGPDAVTLDRAVPVHSLPGFDAGNVSVQDAGAQWAARLLDAQPGERVLDACAAPGGKASAIAQTPAMTSQVRDDFNIAFSPSDCIQGYVRSAHAATSQRVRRPFLFGQGSAMEHATVLSRVAVDHILA